MPYPIFVNLQGRRCVVVGGGQVAERRAASLLEQSAQVVVIAPVVSENLWELSRRSANFSWKNDLFRADDLNGAFLAIAATDDAVVNTSVAAAARERGVLVCRADEPEGGDFITPAVLERGQLTVALSTGGASPTLAALLMERLRAEYGPEWAGITALIARLRPEIKKIPSEPRRRMFVERVLENQSIRDNLIQGDSDAAVAEAMRCI